MFCFLLELNMKPVEPGSDHRLGQAGAKHEKVGNRGRYKVFNIYHINLYIYIYIYIYGHSHTYMILITFLKFLRQAKVYKPNDAKLHFLT